MQVVSAPDPNQPHAVRIASSITRGSDPRWGWLGSGAETSIQAEHAALGVISSSLLASL